MNLGKLRNFHEASTAGQMAKKPTAQPKDSGVTEAEHDEEPGQDGAHTTLHDHGDGTFHTEGHDGEKMEHPSLGHALMHMHGRHADGMPGMHVHADGMGGYTTHHHDGEQLHGPHEHGSTEELQHHVGQVMGEYDHGEHESEGAEEMSGEHGLAGLDAHLHSSY